MQRVLLVATAGATSVMIDDVVTDRGDDSLDLPAAGLAVSATSHFCALAPIPSTRQLAVDRCWSWGCFPVAWKMTRRAISTVWSANRS